MKKAFEVFWADTAERDLLGIIEFIAGEDPESALEILNRIRTRTASLDRTPARGRLVPELLDQGISGYPELAIGPWRVIYRTEAMKVHVLSVLDSRCNVEDILLARFLR